ncbi:hypothetical protein IAT38_001224 [Cryptococcus sp. DSM 104549]
MFPPAGITKPKNSYRYAIDVFIAFFKDDDILRDDERMELVKRDADGSYSGTKKWTSSQYNPCKKVLERVLAEVKNGKYEREFGFDPSWTTWEDIPSRSDRHMLELKCPYYFLLRQLVGGDSAPSELAPPSASLPRKRPTSRKSDPASPLAQRKRAPTPESVSPPSVLDELPPLPDDIAPLAPSTKRSRGHTSASPPRSSTPSSDDEDAKPSISPPPPRKRHRSSLNELAVAPRQIAPHATSSSEVKLAKAKRPRMRRCCPPVPALPEKRRREKGERDVKPSKADLAREELRNGSKHAPIAVDPSSDASMESSGEEGSGEEGSEEEGEAPVPAPQKRRREKIDQVVKPSKADLAREQLAERPSAKKSLKTVPIGRAAKLVKVKVEKEGEEAPKDVKKEAKRKAKDGAKDDEMETQEEERKERKDEKRKKEKASPLTPAPSKSNPDREASDAPLAEIKPSKAGAGAGKGGKKAEVGLAKRGAEPGQGGEKTGPAIGYNEKGFFTGEMEHRYLIRWLPSWHGIHDFKRQLRRSVVDGLDLDELRRVIMGNDQIPDKWFKPSVVLWQSKKPPGYLFTSLHERCKVELGYRVLQLALEQW